jgi:hypothetical protein
MVSFCVAVPSFAIGQRLCSHFSGDLIKTKNQLGKMILLRASPTTCKIDLPNLMIWQVAIFLASEKKLSLQQFAIPT